MFAATCRHSGRLFSARGMSQQSVVRLDVQYLLFVGGGRTLLNAFFLLFSFLLH